MRGGQQKKKESKFQNVYCFWWMWCISHFRSRNSINLRISTSSCFNSICLLFLIAKKQIVLYLVSLGLRARHTLTHVFRQIPIEECCSNELNNTESENKFYHKTIEETICERFKKRNKWEHFNCFFLHGIFEWRVDGILLKFAIDISVRSF